MYFCTSACLKNVVPFLLINMCLVCILHTYTDNSWVKNITFSIRVHIHNIYNIKYTFALQIKKWQNYKLNPIEIKKCQNYEHKNSIRSFQSLFVSPQIRENRALSQDIPLPSLSFHLTARCFKLHQNLLASLQILIPESCMEFANFLIDKQCMYNYIRVTRVTYERFARFVAANVYFFSFLFVIASCVNVIAKNSRRHVLIDMPRRQSFLLSLSRLKLRWFFPRLLSSVSRKCVFSRLAATRACTDSLEYFASDR